MFAIPAIGQRRRGHRWAFVGLACAVLPVCANSAPEGAAMVRAIRLPCHLISVNIYANPLH